MCHWLRAGTPVAPTRCAAELRGLTRPRALRWTQGIVGIAAAVTLHCAVAFLGSVISFAVPAPKPKPRSPASSGGGGALAAAAPGAGSARASGAGRSSGGGNGASRGSSSGGASAAAAAALGMGQPDPERGEAEAMDLGEPISIIATVIEEGAEGPDAPDGAPIEAGGAPGAAAGGFWRRVCGCGARAGGSGGDGSGIASPRKGSAAGSAGSGAGAAPVRGPEPLVGVLAVASALLAMAAALRGASMYSGDLWWSDRLLFPLQALPELLSAVLLVAWPHFMARIGMASRYARWQPKKGKPATSRPKNSNPAIWKRAGMPAPESRTQTTSEGV